MLPIRKKVGSNGKITIKEHSCNEIKPKLKK